MVPPPLVAVLGTVVLVLLLSDRGQGTNDDLAMGTIDSSGTVEWLRGNNPAVLDCFSQELPTDSETFHYIGRTEPPHVYYVGMLERVTGISRRGHQRLVVFDSIGACLGSYYGTYEMPLSLSGDTLIVPVRETVGNRAIFSEEDPPQTIWIDGYVNDFTPIELWIGEKSVAPSREK